MVIAGGRREQNGTRSSTPDYMWVIFEVLTLILSCGFMAFYYRIQAKKQTLGHAYINDENVL